MALQISRLIGCNVYVSEGRNLQLIRRLEDLCQQHSRVALANTFIDSPYNRTGLTLVATSISELSAAVATVAQAALSALDLRSHAADHPRLGVVDHISLHPLGHQATLQHAATAAAAIGQQLAAEPFCLPVYYYGAAHPAGRRLAEIRRQLGYFRSNSSQIVEQQQQLNPHQSGPGTSPSTISSSTNTTTSSSSSNSSSSSSWIGSISPQQLHSYPPDAGPLQVPPAAGVVTIGAVPWVVNYNVPLYTSDMSAARAVSRAVSARGGGLPGVEAMALQHGHGVIEVATNLIDTNWSNYDSSSSSSSGSSDSGSQWQQAVNAAAALHETELKQRGAGPAEVQAAVAAAAQQHGLPAPGAGYITNKLPHELVEFARQRLLL